ncbi:MAG: PAS domain-containing protein, partial [Xanthomonadaceae bacterium]|nr:PAS domain-containing protein [Xanthomonadaceae bacterium]
MNDDRVRARRLAAQLRDLRTVACALRDALVLLDPDGRVRWCNPAAAQLLGIAWPRDRGVSMDARFGDGEVGAWLRVRDDDADDVGSPVDPGVRLQLSVIPYGEHRRLLIARDISRVTRLEQVRRDFVANVSHELRTPLTVIHGYLELLDPGEVPALAPVLNEMRTQSQRMRQIVEDLLELSRLEMQQHVPEERVEMAPLLQSLRREA